MPGSYVRYDDLGRSRSSLQKETASLAIQKAGLKTQDIRMVFAGDLLAQTIASSFRYSGHGTSLLWPLRSLFHHGRSAFPGSMAAAAGYGEHILCATSQSFRHSRKRIPVSLKLRKPKTSVRHMDGYRKRSLHHKFSSSKGKAGCPTVNVKTAAL